MLYELAWCNRLQADVANDAARQKLRREAAERVRSNLARQSGSEGVPVLAGRSSRRRPPCRSARRRSRRGTTINP